MLKWWQNRQQRKMYRPGAEKLYLAASVAARRPALFAAFGVPDTFDGRFDCLMMHTALVFNRLHAIGTPAAEAMGQQFFDALFTQLELAVRESGVSDIGTPRHVKRMMTACQGRTLAYREALATGETAVVADALRRNLFGTVAAPDLAALQSLATYLQAESAHAATLDEAALLRGEFVYTPLPAFSHEETQWPNAA